MVATTLSVSVPIFAFLLSCYAVYKIATYTRRGRTGLWAAPVYLSDKMEYKTRDGWGGSTSPQDARFKGFVLWHKGIHDTDQTPFQTTECN